MRIQTKKLSLVAIAAFMLTGCGGGNNSKPAEVSSAPSSTSESHVTAAESSQNASIPTQTSEAQSSVESSEQKQSVSSEQSVPDASQEESKPSEISSVAPAESSEISSVAPAESSEPAGSVEYPAKLDLTFWTTFGQSNLEVLQSIADEFCGLVKNEIGTELTIACQYKGAYDDIENAIYSGLGTGNIPNMAIAYPDHVANYISAGNTDPQRYVYNLDSYFNDPEIGFGKQAWLGDVENGNVFDEDDFVEAFIDEGKHYLIDGTYSMPFMKSSEALFYNLEAACLAFKFWKGTDFSKKQVTDYMNNITWDEFMELCESVKENKESIKKTLKVPMYYDSDENFIISKFYQKEIGYSSIDSSGVPHIDFETGENRAKAEALVNEIKGYYDNGLLSTKKIEGTYGSNWFKNQETIFSIGSTGGTGYNMPDAGVFTVGVCPVPASNNNPLYVSQGPTITFLKNSAQSAETNDMQQRFAFMFAKYLTNPKSNVKMCIYASEGYLPVRYSAYESAEFSEYLGGDDDDIYTKSYNCLINQIDGNYLNTPVFPGSDELRDQTGAVINSVCKGGKTATEAITIAIENTKNKM